MTAEKCQCAGGHPDPGSCAACRVEEELFSYWCQTCKRQVAEKRCPYCGLKAQKKKDAAGSSQNGR